MKPRAERACPEPQRRLRSPRDQSLNSDPVAKDSKKKLGRDEARRQRRKLAIPQLVKRAHKKPSSLPVADPTSASPEVLNRIARLVEAGAGGDVASTHSARLLDRGLPQVAQKFGEEAVECVIALLGGDKTQIVGESADVLYHLLVAWAAAGVAPQDVWAELQRREELSALIEGSQSADKNALRLAVGTSKIPV